MQNLSEQGTTAGIHDAGHTVNISAPAVQAPLRQAADVIKAAHYPTPASVPAAAAAAAAMHSGAQQQRSSQLQNIAGAQLGSTSPHSISPVASRTPSPLGEAALIYTLDAHALCTYVSMANNRLALLLLHQPLYCCTRIFFVPAKDFDSAKGADHHALGQSENVAMQSMQSHPLKVVASTRSDAALTCKQVLLLLARRLKSAPDSLCQLLLLLTQHQLTQVLLVPEAQVLMMLSQPAT